MTPALLRFLLKVFILQQNLRVLVTFIVLSYFQTKSKLPVFCKQKLSITIGVLSSPFPRFDSANNYPSNVVCIARNVKVSCAIVKTIKNSGDEVLNPREITVNKLKISNKKLSYHLFSNRLILFFLE